MKAREIPPAPYAGYFAAQGKARVPSIASMLGKIRKILTYAPMLLPYFWYHKVIFGITNTKFDISFCVFRESFLADQYRIREFLDRQKSADELFVLDLGRNHGFVFYYMMYRIMKGDFSVKKVIYLGIDPSPLKFVYFNYFKFLRSKNIEVKYFLIDKAVVFDDSTHARLKYGEKNFGNFNILGSNYQKNLSHAQSQYEYAYINVETISLDAIKSIVSEHLDADAIIAKIDCKNRTDCIFADLLDMMAGRDGPYLIACEKDGSSERDLAKFAHENRKTLCASNILP